MRHPDAKPSRVLGYCRVSSREQGRDGTSLDAQRDRVERHCRERGYPKPRLFVEVESGGAEKIEKRDELRQLIAEARPGDLICVSLVDRWSRDLVYGVDSVRKLVGAGVGWYSVSEGIDATTPQGDSTLGLMAWVADQERRRIRERTVGRRQELKDQGLYVEGPAPFGYRRGSREEHKQLTLEVMPDEAALVREAFAMCIAGESVGRIREWMEVELGRAVDKKRAHEMLRLRVYLGEVKSSSGAWIPATHPPIITRDIYERAQLAMASRRLVGPNPSADARTASWLLRGLASCPDCGARMSASYSTKAASGGYYACVRRLRAAGACHADYVRLDQADAAVDAAALEQLRRYTRELAKPAHALPVPRKPRDFDAERARLRSGRERAVRLATDGTITREDLGRELARLDQDLGRLEVAAGAAARAETAANPEARRSLLADVGRLEAAWKVAPVEVRRTALRGLARTIVLRKAGPEIVWRTAEELAQDLAAVGAHLFAAPTASRSRSTTKRRVK